MENLECIFLEPVNLGTEEAPDFEFSQINCTSTDIRTELIQNTETGAEFYLEKTIDYGGILILVFLLLFAIFGIVKIITDFWIPRRTTKKN